MESAQTIDSLNKLLRGELSALETYQQALDKIDDELTTKELNRIANEHRESANLLKQQIEDIGGEPNRSSGVWGVWARTVQGAAKLLGENATLKVLKEGEEHGLKDYQEALSNQNLPLHTRTLLTSDLISKQREHIEVLDRFIGTKH